MTKLEQEILRDGFRLALLVVEARPERDSLRFDARLFDGGRLQTAVNWQGPYSRPDPVALKNLRALLRQVLEPPYLLAGAGAGWRLFLDEQFAAIAGEFRLFDLAATAGALTGLAAHSLYSKLAQVYGLGPIADDDAGGLPAWDDLLWAVLHHAGERGLTRQSLLTFAESAQEFGRLFHAAGRAMDAAEFPASPGVYIMRSSGGAALYVGKAANLSRRLHDYFLSTWCPDEKLIAIRNQVVKIDYMTVGSELEALLQENRLIRDLAPVINVQREIHLETREPEAAYFPPTAVIADSATAGALELFLISARDPVCQLRVKPSRIPEKTLTALVRRALGGPALAAKAKNLVRWGPEGSLICRRYFERYRHQLRWLSLEPGEGGLSGVVARLKSVIATTAASPAEPGEFRG